MTNVRIAIRRGALESIFDECDRHDADETGGRLVGVYSMRPDGGLGIEVTGVIEPGPRASRTAVSFYQDGKHQEEIFRKLEAQNPEIEHLGNWHTHHVNGFPTLSSGDRTTYHRIVNHRMHNTDFFYGLLVVSRNAGRAGVDRYETRHFLLRRGDPAEYEIPVANVEVVEGAALSPRAEAAENNQAVHGLGRVQRAMDRSVLAELQPELKPYQSKKTGTLYWKGRLRLLDGASIGIVVVENEQQEGSASYSIAASSEAALLDEASTVVSEREFASAIEAVWSLERCLNDKIFEGRAARRARRSKRKA